MRLYRVELRRLLARRFTRLAMLLFVAGLGLTVFLAGHNTHRPTISELATAQQQAQVTNQQQAHDCLRSKANPSDPTTQQYAGQDCATLEQLKPENMLPFREFSLHEQLASNVLAVSVLLTGFGFLVGASFIGAEWIHTTMSGLLLWESRRTKVFLTKLAAVWSLVTVVGIAGYAALGAALWAVAHSRGTTAGVTVAFDQSMGLEAARGVAVALAITAVGFALAYTTRLTAAAVGVAFAYLVAGELGMHAISQSGARWLVSSNLAAWVSNGFSIYVDEACTSAGGCTSREIHLPLWQGGAYLGAIALALLVISGVVFARRDVT
jgi:ABC-2 type transport system permease protein